MRRKSLRFQTWLMLLGMLFHVLVSHQDGSPDLLLCRHSDGHFVLESGLHHVLTHHEALLGHAAGHSGAHLDAHAVGHDDYPMPSHHHLSVEHSEAYISPSGSLDQALLAQRLGSLLASLPLLLEPPRPSLRLSSLWDRPEPQPPPEQTQLALSTTILLI